MIKNLVSTLGATIIALGVLSSNTQAATLDFTTNPFIGANGNFAGTTYAISATGGSLSFSQSQDGNTCVGLYCTTDGLGVDNDTGGFDDDDEISSNGGGQSIIINFGQQILITGFSFLDLFTDQLIFTVFNGGLQGRGYGDYALASIVSAVPLPPALLMVGAAFGGIGFLTSRRKKTLKA